MYKIDWSKYLSADRVRKSEFKENVNIPSSNDKRNDFDSDFGRVAFSSALRRMHDKAQVIPLTSGDSVHTRLTHSIEVMNIANSIGVSLCRHKDFVDTYGQEEAMNLERQISSILRTAAIIHDIGNPPFGHFGETVIQNYFREYLKVHIIKEDQKLDFTEFDGNAEGLRILTKLQYLGDLTGFNLTFATLAAYMKYPNIKSKDKSYIGTKKHGVFTSEKEVFNKIVSACHMQMGNGRIKRHPLSFLVEAADTICYSVMDIEDSFSMGWFAFDEIVSFFDKQLDKNQIKDILSLEDTIKEGGKEIPKNDKRKMVDFRVKLIRYFVELALTNFIKYLELIDNGKYSRELTDDDEYHLAGICQNFAQRYIFPQRQIEQTELIGHEVLTGLLDHLLAYVFKDEKKYRMKSKSVFSKNALRVAIHENKLMTDHAALFMDITEDQLWEFDPEELDDYGKLRMVVDLVSGMTDKYACSLYDKLSGHSL